MKMQSLNNKPVRAVAVAFAIAGGTILFSGRTGSELLAKDNQTIHLNIPVSMQEMLSKPEYAEDLKVHKRIASGEINKDTLKNRGGLMTGSSTYVEDINGQLVACTVNKDTLKAYFGFMNFPAEWRAQQRDRETSDLKGAEVPIKIKSSKYTEAAIYGHEGLIVLYTPHDRPEMKSSRFIFYPFTNPKKQWNYGTLVENGPVGKRFVSKKEWYDPYGLDQGEGGITMLTQNGEDAYCHFLPRGYFITIAERIPAKASAKHTVKMNGNEMTVSVKDGKDLKITIYPVFKGETAQLTGTLNSMNPSDQLAPVISKMPVEAGSDLERVLAIEQTALGEPNVVLSEPLSPEKMVAYFGTDRFGGREISTVDLGVGSYVALDKNHGKAWVLATVDAVCLAYAQSESGQLMFIQLHFGSLMISNPDAPLNRQKPVFAASEDGAVVSWVEKSGAFKVFYPSSGIQIETQVDARMKGARIEIDRSLNRVTLKSGNFADVRVDVNEAVYAFDGEEIRLKPIKPK